MIFKMLRIKKLFLFILVIFTIHFVDSVIIQENQNLQIQCVKIRHGGFWFSFPNHEYTMCIDKPSSLRVNTPEMEISKVLANNGSEIEEYHVIEAVHIQDATSIKFIPIFKNVLINLKAILIAKCGLKYIFVDDMKQFGADLEFASFHGNEISYLADDLFRFNVNLMYVSLAANPIKQIHPEFRENLNAHRSIKRFVIGGGIDACVNYVSLNLTTGDRIDDLQWNNKECSDDIVNDDYLRNLARARRISPIYESVEKLRNDQEIQTTKLESLKTEIAWSNERITSESETQNRNEELFMIEISEMNKMIVSQGDKIKELEESLRSEVEEIKKNLSKLVIKLNDA